MTEDVTVTRDTGVTPGASWSLMCLWLDGSRMPVPPRIKGRVHICRGADDDLPTPTELGRRLGITRQAAAARLKKLRADFPTSNPEGSA